MSVETHRLVFPFVWMFWRRRGCSGGRWGGRDGAEANAALRSLVRRDTGEGYEQFLTGLARPPASRRRPSRTWPG
jgi:hypothetical protein